MLALAFRADGRHTLGIPAIMAEQAAVAPMIGEGNRAVSALYALAAGAAGYKARKTAAVEQQHGLLAVFDALADGFHQTPRKGGLLSRFEEFLRISIRSTRGSGRFSIRSGNSSSVYFSRWT